ncbi:TetR-like C-terminal domain-containing protein, partial [Halanaerobium saccharolyticum]|uniref:TetR-like C-terminal domain-containing protein n=1 Tax=Halanaerobium saccharolyticum TaxID=43595 RepID=UPI003FCE5A29
AMSAGDRPPYLASGLAYIEFARTEPNLFTLLFMHRRTPEQMEQSSIQLRPVIEIIARHVGVGYDEAYAFHMRMWVYVHGIASMIVTGYLDWDEAFAEHSL